MNVLTFARHVTQSAARVVQVRGEAAATQVPQDVLLSDASVYVVTERRFFHDQKVQEVDRIGVTPEGDFTIVAKPPLVTSSVVLYHARWLTIPVIGFLLVSIGVAIGYAV